MMVNRAKCDECGAAVDYITRDGDLRCECGGVMEFVGKVGCVISVANDIRPEARELAEEWRESAENDDEKGYTNAAGSWAVAAKELEEIIDA